jgi:type IV pilus assembly protein PilM
MWDFSRKKGAALGIDIGARAIKQLQLRRLGRGYRVEHCAVRPLPPGAVDAKRLVDGAAVGAVLQTMAQERPRLSRRAVVAVPGSAVITRTLEFDATLSAAELELQVFLDAERHIPFAPGEIALDFVRLDSPASSPASVTVLLAACRKEHRDSRVAALLRGGYVAAVVEVETQAVERAFALLEVAQGVAALVDMGSDGFTLYVLRDGEVIYSREQALAPAQFGVLDSGPMIPEFAERDRVAQLNRALQVFYSSSTHQSVDCIVLAGSGAVPSGFAALVETLLQIPVALANPFAAMTCAAGVDARQLECEGPLWFLAAGLALRGLRDA